ncbi:MAG TPA: sodium:proton antiporter, partial [Nocardioidaceae bacterium]|nr:sodium:proton antiporter [Nocardioidaceae bacterium]
MHIALTLVVLATCAIAGTALARRIGLSAPLLLVVAGFVGSYVPFIPDVALTTDLVLIGFLPPLLYAAAIR